MFVQLTGSCLVYLVKVLNIESIISEWHITEKYNGYDL